MKIPQSLWRRLSPNAKRLVILLVSLLIFLNVITSYLTIPFHFLITGFLLLWRSRIPVFIGAFTTIVSLPLLFIMPVHPMAVPATFGAGISVSVILLIFK